MVENELSFIERLTAQCPVLPPVSVGIGDDGAVLNCAGEQSQVVVTDMLLDGVHFDLREIEPALAGRKAIAVNLSDLAAMGCRPTAAFVSIAVPPASMLHQFRSRIDSERSATSEGERVSDSEWFLTSLYQGMQQMATEYHFCIAGGDTNSWQGSFAINVCLIGVPLRERAILRSGGRPGDLIYVTGPLGGSLASHRHLKFTPRLKAAEWLLSHVQVHAMMDISDGLSIDLSRLAHASQVSAVIQSQKLPVHSDVPRTLNRQQQLAAALHNGEDFELLVCLPPEEAEKLDRLSDEHPVPLSRIGELREGAGCWLLDDNGQTGPLPVGGWEHRF